MDNTLCFYQYFPSIENDIDNYFISKPMENEELIKSVNEQLQASIWSKNSEHNRLSSQDVQGSTG